jgi:hypothetical protein
VPRRDHSFTASSLKPIRATLEPRDVLQPKRNIRGEYVIWLDDRIVARLARLRDEGEDVILRLAKAEGGLG